MSTEQLSAEERELVKVVRDFVDRQVKPDVQELEHANTYPEAFIETMKEIGIYGLAIDEPWGPGRVSTECYVLVTEELARGWMSLAGAMGGHTVVAKLLQDFGTPEQQERYLPGLAAGELVASFALTEPDAGSDPSGMRARAVRDGDGYRISGQKRYITNAPEADLFMVFARTGESSEGTKGISVFAVEADLDGVTVGPADAKMGQKGAHTAEVFLDEVRVGPEALIGGVEGEGFATAMRSLAKGRLHIGALCVGLAERLVEDSLAHATSQTQGGTPIADFQLVQAMLADSRTEAYAGRAMVLEAARRYDDGSDTRMGPSAAKLFCTEMVDRVADRAVQIHGGLGYMQEVKVSRFYRDARLFRLYEGTSEIQRTIIAKQMIRGARA